MAWWRGGPCRTVWALQLEGRELSQGGRCTPRYCCCSPRAPGWGCGGSVGRGAVRLIAPPPSPWSRQGRAEQLCCAPGARGQRLRGVKVELGSRGDRPGVRLGRLGQGSRRPRPRLLATWPRPVPASLSGLQATPKAARSSRASWWPLSWLWAGCARPAESTPLIAWPPGAGGSLHGVSAVWWPQDSQAQVSTDRLRARGGQTGCL